MRIRQVHVSTITTGVVAQASGSVLWSVNINTAGSGGLLKIYNNVSAVAADLIASIDLTNQGSYWYGVYCEKGIFYALSVAAADVTIGYQ